MKKKRGIFPIAVMTILSILLTETLAWSDSLDVWHKRDAVTTSRLQDIIYAKELFVAVGDIGTILTSADGVKWTPRNSGTTNNLEGVSYENGAFFALGEEGTLLTSAEGSVWIPLAMESGILYEIAYGAGSYVVVGWDYIAKSSNLNTWQKSKTNPGAYHIIYGKQQFLYSGEWGDINTSSDGMNWTTVLNNHCYIGPILLVNNAFYTIGCASGSVGYRSVNGATWYEISDLVEPNIVYSGIAYGSGILAVVGTNGKIMVSTNGLDWDTRTAPSLTTWAPKLAFGNNSFVVVGADGAIFQSDPIEPATDYDLDGITDLDNCADRYNPDQIDSDGDGRGDVCDQCPNDPNKFQRGICGCGYPEDTGDSDLDGVMNCKDAFPYDRTEAFDNDTDGIGNNADPDDDNDGMPDTWEIAHGLDPLINDAGQDPDGDGFTNLEEYQKKTDPKNANSYPKAKKPLPWLPLILDE